MKGFQSSVVQIALVLTSAASVALTIPVSQAGASIAQCPSGYACMWSSSSFTNWLWADKVNSTYVGTPYNDKNDSTYNNTSVGNDAAWYANSNYGGYVNCNTPQSGDSNDYNLSTGGLSTFQNTISSMKFFVNGSMSCSSWN